MRLTVALALILFSVAGCSAPQRSAALHLTTTAMEIGASEIVFWASRP